MKVLVNVGVIFLICFSPYNLHCQEKVVYYSEHGAVGDGVADDFDAIIKAHDAANKAGLKVRADVGATYYIGGADKTAVIQTDTDWGNAKFIIDDTKVENRNKQIFNVSSKNPPTVVTSVKTLEKNQDKLDLSFPHASFIVVTDSTTMRYIREGPNRNNGAAQTDVFVIGPHGLVDMTAPIIWDYNNITNMTAYPIDSEPLKISGGHFTTVANQAESRYTYYSRGIGITRSNVVVDGLYHDIVGEMDHGAPYGGFISISNCTRVTVQNCKLSGHKTYGTIGSANTPVLMGSYDITVNRATNVIFRNCKQINDIHDTKLWGIFASNYSKNITFDNVEFSRFDAHMGVVNATIKNSILGHQGINIIGSGVFLIENTKVCGANFINLRSDYGSTWEGELIIRNCEYVPRNGAQSDAVMVSGNYSGQHDFGYKCYMPKKITIDDLMIDDSNPVGNYTGPKIFANFNKAYTSEEYIEKYPYTLPEEVFIRNLKIKSGKPYHVSSNLFMFRNVKVTEYNSSIAAEDIVINAEFVESSKNQTILNVTIKNNSDTAIAIDLRSLKNPYVTIFYRAGNRTHISGNPPSWRHRSDSLELKEWLIRNNQLEIIPAKKDFSMQVDVTPKVLKLLEKGPNVYISEMENLKIKLQFINLLFGEKYEDNNIFYNEELFEAKWSVNSNTRKL